MKASWTYARRETTGDAWDDEEIEVTASGGTVNIAVTDEKAVDSYNSVFTCSITLPREKVRELRDLLNAVVAVDEQHEPLSVAPPEK